MRYRMIQATVLLTALAMTGLFIRSSAQSQPQSSQSSPQSSQSSSQNNDQQTLDGCLVREEHAIYLMPASGDKTRLSSGGQDLSSHMGEEVKLSGNQSGSQSSSPNSASSASAGGSSAGASDDNQFVVTKVDVVAHTCPTDIQGRIDQDKKKSR
jgi:hypothetical protein